MSGQSTDLTNAGTIEALTGGQIRSYANTLTNNTGGIITADGLNAPALALANRPNGFYSSTVFLGDNTFNIPTLNNSGSLQATNGGLVSVNANTLTNNGDISAQGLDVGSGLVSTVTLGNYNTNINQITNNSTIRAQDGGQTNIKFNMLNNPGTLRAQGTGFTGASLDMSGNTVSQYSPATLNLTGINTSITSDALTNTGTIATSGGGEIGTTFATSVVPFTNQGTISADGVGLSTSTLMPSGETIALYNASSTFIGQGSYYNSAQFVGGTLTNGANGILAATNGGHLSLSVGGGSLINSGQVLVDGTGLFNQGTLAGVSQFATYQNSSAAFYSSVVEYPDDTTGNPARGGAFLNTGSMTVNNGGNLQITANTGLTNSGNIIVHSQQNGYLSSATLTSNVYTSSNHVASGGNIALAGGSIDVYAGGQFSAIAQTNITQSAGVSLTARDSGTGVFLQSGGDLNNNGLIDASVGAALTLNAGSLTNSGNINASSGATLNATIQNSVTNSGSIQYGLGALTSNIAGGTFTNSGTIHTEGGALDISGATSITNSGTLDIRLSTGALTLNGGSFTNSGTIGAPFGATLNGTIENNFLSQTGSRIDYGLGTLTLNNTGGTFVNNGTIHTEGGVLNVRNATGITNSGTLLSVGSTAILNLNTPGNLTNSGIIQTNFGGALNGTVQGSLTNTGTGEIHSVGGTFTTNSVGGTFSNIGILDANGGAIIAANATSITNTGNVTAQNGGHVTTQNNAVVNNSGAVRAGAFSTITFNGGETQTGASSRTQVDGGGGLTVGGSGLKLGAGATAGDGGTAAGSGTITGNIFNASGVVAPGDAANAGTLTETGNYAQGANGAARVKLGGTAQGTDYDLFRVSGTAALAGQLQVKLSNMFTPYVGETFDIMTFSSHTGAFDSIFSLDPGYDYSVAYTADTAILHVDDIAPVPETGTLVSLGLMIAGGAFVLRRKRR